MRPPPPVALRGQQLRVEMLRAQHSVPAATLQLCTGQKGEVTGTASSRGTSVPSSLSTWGAQAPGVPASTPGLR